MDPWLQYGPLKIPRSPTSHQLLSAPINHQLPSFPSQAQIVRNIGLVKGHIFEVPCEYPSSGVTSPWHAHPGPVCTVQTPRLNPCKYQWCVATKKLHQGSLMIDMFEIWERLHAMPKDIKHQLSLPTCPAVSTIVPAIISSAARLRTVQYAKPVPTELANFTASRFDLSNSNTGLLKNMTCGLWQVHTSLFFPFHTWAAYYLR